jgi:hypothetical protein
MRKTRIYWDSHTNDGYAYAIEDSRDTDYVESGPAGDAMELALRGTERGLTLAAEAMGLDPAKATEWNPTEEGGWAEWAERAARSD